MTANVILGLLSSFWIHPDQHVWGRVYLAFSHVMYICLFCAHTHTRVCHYNDVIKGPMASRITSLAIVYSAVYSGVDQEKTSKLRVTGLCAGNSPGTVEFPAQMASNAENASIWWRHHANNPCPSITGHLFKFSLKSTAWMTSNIQGGCPF